VGNTSCFLVFSGGRRSAFFLSRSHRGVRDAPREEKNTQTESKECVSRNHRTPCAFTASRAHRIRARFRGIFFSSSHRERERTIIIIGARILLTKKKAIKKTSKSALASSDANARFQNKRRVVKRTVVRDFIATALPTKAVCWTLVAANIFSSVSFLRKNSEVTCSLSICFFCFSSLSLLCVCGENIDPLLSRSC
jgi:hypothetical protein